MKTLSSKKYIESGGVSCPRCKDSHIEGNSVEIDEGCAWQNVYCLSCELEWTDIYTLTSIEHVQDDENVFKVVS